MAIPAKVGTTQKCPKVGRIDPRWPQTRHDRAGVGWQGVHFDEVLAKVMTIAVDKVARKMDAQTIDWNRFEVDAHFEHARVGVLLSPVPKSPGTRTTNPHLSSRSPKVHEVCIDVGVIIGSLYVMSE